MSLENKVALVTGATRGIGKAIAEALLKLGATVVGTATSEEGAQRISAYIQASGGKELALELEKSGYAGYQGKAA